MGADDVRKGLLQESGYDHGYIHGKQGGLVHRRNDTHGATKVRPRVTGVTVHMRAERGKKHAASAEGREGEGERRVASRLPASPITTFGRRRQWSCRTPPPTAMHISMVLLDGRALLRC